MSRYILMIYTTNCINEHIPKSIEEAVEILFELLTCSFAPIALSLDKKEFSIKFHHTLGMWIRNCFGLWSDDCKIIENYHPLLADFLSGYILEILWDRFKERCKDVELSEERYETFLKLVNVTMKGYT